MALDTLANVKDALGISTTDQDTQIGALLEPVSALIEREAGRRFASETVTERHNGGEATILLREHPVASITTVTDKALGTVLGSDQYALESNGLLRRLPLGSKWALARIDQVIYLRKNTPASRWEIVYVGGPATVPEDVKLALYESIASQLAGQGGMQSEKDGDYAYSRAPSTTGASALTAGALAIARSYRAGVFI